MKKINAIVCFSFIMLLFFTGCGNETISQESKEYLQGCSKYALKKVINNGLLEPTWKTLNGFQGKRAYQVTGRSYYPGELSSVDLEITMENGVGTLTKLQVGEDEIDTDEFISDLCYKTAIKETGVTKRFQLPVETIYNQDAYALSGNVPAMVTVTVSSEKSAMEDFEEYILPDLKAVLDLSSYKMFDTPKAIPFSLSKSKKLHNFLYRIEPISVDVTLEDLVAEVKPVEVFPVYGEGSKGTVSSIVPDRAEVIVKGSKKELLKVASVKAFIDVSGLEPRAEYRLQNIFLKAYDINGKVLKTIVVVPTTISVDMMIVEN